MLARFEFLFRRAKQALFGLAEQHELAAGHLDLRDAQSFQLRNHVVDRKVVVAVGADSDVQLGRA